MAVFKAHITTGPSDKVLDLFWIYDNKKELPENHRLASSTDKADAVSSHAIVPLCHKATTCSSACPAEEYGSAASMHQSAVDMLPQLLYIVLHSCIACHQSFDHAAESKKKEKFTPLGLITGASVSKSSLRHA